MKISAESMIASKLFQTTLLTHTCPPRLPLMNFAPGSTVLAFDPLTKRIITPTWDKEFRHARQEKKNTHWKNHQMIGVIATDFQEGTWRWYSVPDGCILTGMYEKSTDSVWIMTSACTSKEQDTYLHNRRPTWLHLTPKTTLNINTALLQYNKKWCIYDDNNLSSH